MAMSAIRDFRLIRNMTQEQLGQLIGVQKAAVSKWEAGIPPSACSAIKIEQATNGELPKWKIRPDLWDAPHQAEVA